MLMRQKIAGIFADAARFDGQEITVCGWVRTVRDMKNFGFIELNDGSCFKRGPDRARKAGADPGGQAAL